MNNEDKSRKVYIVSFHMHMQISFLINHSFPQLKKKLFDPEKNLIKRNDELIIKPR